MKVLSGSDLAGFIKQRQARQVGGIVGRGIKPKLAIVLSIDNEVINTYVRLKIAYGVDIGVEVEKFVVGPDDIKQVIEKLNKDEAVHGIIVQLPLEPSIDQDAVLNLVAKEKDVDGLSDGSPYDPATPVAIMWLLEGYNVDVRGKKFVVVGQGPLVGGPLTAILKKAEHKVTTVDETTKDLAGILADADIIITATGSPNLINSSMIPENCVVIDAGVAVASGKKVGDLSSDVYEREDLKLTPKFGGVGPLTVCALFDNVIKAANSKASS